ncbi:MAG: hypothetical protein ACYC9Z_08845 [Casimicrobiaceae bacterium]
MGKHALRLNQVHGGHPVDRFPSGMRGQKGADLRADRIEVAPMKHSWPRPRHSAERAESRIAERAATALLRAIENSTQVPAAFILDEEDLTIGPGRSAPANPSDAMG